MGPRSKDAIADALGAILVELRETRAYMMRQDQARERTREELEAQLDQLGEQVQDHERRLAAGFGGR